MNSSQAKKVLRHLHETAIAVPRVGSGKLASAIVYKGDIIAVGVNQYKTHPMQVKWMSNPHRNTLHAEINAICRASRLLHEDDFAKSTILVARAKKDTDSRVWIPGLARPCIGCMNCISAFNFREIYYTTDDSVIGYIKL